jgi:hypothetical protein
VLKAVSEAQLEPKRLYSEKYMSCRHPNCMLVLLSSP